MPVRRRAIAALATLVAAGCGAGSSAPAPLPAASSTPGPTVNVPLDLTDPPEPAPEPEGPPPAPVCHSLRFLPRPHRCNGTTDCPAIPGGFPEEMQRTRDGKHAFIRAGNLHLSPSGGYTEDVWELDGDKLSPFWKGGDPIPGGGAAADGMMELQLSADDRTLYFVASSGYGSRMALWAFDLAHRTSRAVAAPVWEAAVMSDGRVLTLGPAQKDELSPVDLVDPAAGKQRIAPSLPRDGWRIGEDTGWLLWQTASDTMAVCVGEGAPARIAAPGFKLASAKITVDGHLVAVRRDRSGSALISMSLRGAEPVVLSRPGEEIADDSQVMLEPDGYHLLYVTELGRALDWVAQDAEETKLVLSFGQFMANYDGPAPMAPDLVAVVHRARADGSWHTTLGCRALHPGAKAIDLAAFTDPCPPTSSRALRAALRRKPLPPLAACAPPGEAFAYCVAAAQRADTPAFRRCLGVPVLPATATDKEKGEDALTVGAAMLGLRVHLVQWLGAEDPRPIEVRSDGTVRFRDHDGETRSVSMEQRGCAFHLRARQ